MAPKKKAAGDAAKGEKGDDEEPPRRVKEWIRVLPQHLLRERDRGLVDRLRSQQAGVLGHLRRSLLFLSLLVKREEVETDERVAFPSVILRAQARVVRPRQNRRENGDVVDVVEDHHRAHEDGEDANGRDRDDRRRRERDGGRRRSQ